MDAPLRCPGGVVQCFILHDIWNLSLRETWIRPYYIWSLLFSSHRRVSQPLFVYYLLHIGRLIPPHLFLSSLDCRNCSCRNVFLGRLAVALGKASFALSGSYKALALGKMQTNWHLPPFNWIELLLALETLQHYFLASWQGAKAVAISALVALPLVGTSAKTYRCLDRSNWVHCPLVKGPVFYLLSLWHLESLIHPKAVSLSPTGRDPIPWAFSLQLLSWAPMAPWGATVQLSSKKGLEYILICLSPSSMLTNREENKKSWNLGAPEIYCNLGCHTSHGGLSPQGNRLRWCLLTLCHHVHKPEYFPWWTPTPICTHATCYTALVFSFVLA